MSTHPAPLSDGSGPEADAYALSAPERDATDRGLFRWLYAVAPPVAAVHYAHRERLKPGDPDPLGGAR